MGAVAGVDVWGARGGECGDVVVGADGGDAFVLDEDGFCSGVVGSRVMARAFVIRRFMWGVGCGGARVSIRGS